MSARERKEPSPPKGKSAQGNTVSVPERKEPSSPKGKLQGYPSDLTEQEWEILKPLIPPAKPGGHPCTTNIREVIDAIL